MLNNAAMTSVTTGTGTTLALGSAVDVPASIRGFDTFANAGATNGMIVGYRIQDGVAWEIGTAVYSAAEPQLTSRTVIRSSDGTSAINLSGNQQIFIVPLNGGGGGIGLVTLDGIQTLGNKTLAAPVVNSPVTGSAFAGCLATQSSSTTVNASTWTPITFNTEAYDDLNWHDTVTNNSRITVDAAGRYLIVGNVKVASPDNGVSGIAIAVNGSRVAESIQKTETNVFTGRASSISDVLQLSATDYVELHYYQVGTGSTTTNTSMTRLSVNRLGR